MRLGCIFHCIKQITNELRLRSMDVRNVLFLIILIPNILIELSIVNASYFF